MIRISTEEASREHGYSESQCRDCPIRVLGRSPAPDVENALAIVEQICDLADSGDIPEAGIEFAESVADRARDIGETIEERQYATDNQINALSNMLDALGR